MAAAGAVACVSAPSGWRIIGWAALSATHLLWFCTAHAGRPLSVDDAAVNAAGAGHVEAWLAHTRGQRAQWTVAPAYAPIENLELAVAATHGGEIRGGSYALQAKAVLPWRFGPLGLGASLGAAREAQAGGAGVTRTTRTFGTALATLKLSDDWALNLNLGRQRQQASAAVTTWGLAGEWSWGKTAFHVERFGVRGTPATSQLGARYAVSEAWQLDGTLGRSAGVRLLSVGVKRQF